MLKFRTTKLVNTSLHTDEMNKLEFTFNYKRIKEDELIIRIDTYRILDNGFTELLPTGCLTKIIAGDELTALMIGSKQITQQNNDAIEYMDELIANGIKIVLTTSGKYWKNQLAMEDFE